MAYEAKQAVYLPVTDFLNLEFYLMDARPGVKPDTFATELVNRWLAVEMGQAWRYWPGPQYAAAHAQSQA